MVLHLHLQHILMSVNMLWVFDVFAVIYADCCMCIDGDGLLYICGVSLQAPCCGKFYVCRLCHDDEENHQMDRFKVREVKCASCNTIQEVKSYLSLPINTSYNLLGWISQNLSRCLGITICGYYLTTNPKERINEYIYSAWMHWIDHKWQ